MSYLEKAAPEVHEELKKLGKDINSALDQLRSATETKNTETIQNVEKMLHKYEDENAKFAKAIAAYEQDKKDVAEKIAAAEKAVVEAKSGTEEYKKRLTDLETLLATKGRNDAASPDETARQAPEYKNLMAYLQNRDNYASVEFKTLRTDSETQGAYLIPQIMDNMIRKNITEISPVRMFARVRTAPGKSMEIPRRLALLSAYYEGEGEPSPTDQSIYGSETVTLYRQTVTVPATLDMMVSSAFDLEREIASDVGESFGKGEGRNFVVGVGDKGPQGFIKDSRVEVVQTAAAGVIDFGDMAEIAGKLKRGQAPWWFFNRRTLAKMWQIKSSIGVPIWAPVAGNTPATIWGFPYNSDMIDLDDAQTGSNAKPVVFGDLRRGYEIFDMVGISVIRDDLTRKKEAITEWTFRRYNTGRVILPEAIKVLKIQ